jgi:hypothetical protein
MMNRRNRKIENQHQKVTRHTTATAKTQAAAENN